MSVVENFKFRCIPDFNRRFKPIFKRRKKSVAFHLTFHQREVKVGTERHGLLINLGAATDENVSGKLRRIKPEKVPLEANFRFLPEPGQMKLIRIAQSPGASAQLGFAKNLGMRLAKEDG